MGTTDRFKSTSTPVRKVYYEKSRIRSASFDRHPSTAIHPRAALFLLRSIEIFRQLGLDEVMTRESASNFDLDAGMVVVEKLVGGKTLMSMQESDPKEVAKVNPCIRLWLTQNMFEPLLRNCAKDLGAEQSFSQDIVHYEQQAAGVIVVVQDLDTKQYKKYNTDYLVACDGNRSATREKEGIEWRGTEFWRTIYRSTSKLICDRTSAPGLSMESRTSTIPSSAQVSALKAVDNVSFSSLSGQRDEMASLPTRFPSVKPNNSFTMHPASTTRLT